MDLVFRELFQASSSVANINAGKDIVNVDGSGVACNDPDSSSMQLVLPPTGPTVFKLLK